MVPPSDHPPVECLKALHLALVDVFGIILDAEFENDMHMFKEKFMEAMQKHNLRMTPKVHVLVHHVPKYACRTSVTLGPTSGQALEGQHTPFDIFYRRFEVNCTKSPVIRER